MNDVDNDIQSMYKRIFSADEGNLPIDELMMKRNKQRAIERFHNTFNDDAEAVKDGFGNIIGYKGPSFKSAEAS